MYYYRIYGLEVNSEFELQGGYLVEYDSSLKRKCDVFIRSIFEDEIMPDLHIIDREYGVVRLVDNTSLWIRNGNEIIVNVNDNTDWFVLVQYILAEALPAILFQREVFTIHGSCIEIDNCAIVITGASGAGKSSLANEFIDCGYKFLADDTVAVSVDETEIFVIPAFPQRRLVGDMADRVGLNRQELIELHEDKPKYIIESLSQYCEVKKKLKSLFYICKYPGDTVEISEIVGADKLRFLMDTSYEYKLYINDKLKKEEIENLVNICNNVSFFIVYRPDEGYTTIEQMDTIISKISKI